MTEAGVVQAVRTLNENEIEGLMVFGGNGSQAGAHVLSQKGFPVVGSHQRSTMISTAQRLR